MTVLKVKRFPSETRIEGFLLLCMFNLLETKADSPYPIESSYDVSDSFYPNLMG